MTLAYAASLGLKVWSTNVRAQKINDSSLEIFEIVLVSFQLKNMLGRTCFFLETFLFIATSINIILRILFLALSNVDIVFPDRKFT